MIENKRIQIRRDIALNWTTKNPVLLYGEVGFDMTENNIKIGDGITPWNSLEYISAKVDLSQYYTKEQVDDLIDRIDIPDLTQYYTKEETETKIEEAIEGIEIPETDLSDYYTKEETETKIEEAVEGIEIPETDLTNYYTKEETETKIEEAIQGIEIPETDLTNYYTKEETETKIEEAIQGIEIPEVEEPGKGNIIIKQGDNTQVFNVNQAEDQTIYLGGAEESEWFGTQAEFDALGEYNEETIYHINNLEYKELQNKPFIPRKTSDLVNNVDFTMKRDVKVMMNQREWYGTQAQFDAIENPDPDVIYHIEITETESGVDMSNYYTKAEIDALLAQINNG